MDIAAAKSALREQARGKKLNQAAIGELYLAGYIAIDLQSLAEKAASDSRNREGEATLRSLQGTALCYAFPSLLFSALNFATALLGCSGRKYESLSSLTVRGFVRAFMFSAYPHLIRERIAVEDPGLELSQPVTSCLLCAS